MMSIFHVQFFGESSCGQQTGAGQLHKNEL